MLKYFFHIARGRMNWNIFNVDLLESFECKIDEIKFNLIRSAATFTAE